MINVNYVFDRIPVLYTEELDSFQPVSSDILDDSFQLTVDESYSSLALKNGGFIIADRTGSGSSFAIKNMVSEIQRRRMMQSLTPFHFITIDNSVYDACATMHISLSDYINEIMTVMSITDPGLLVFITDSYIIGDKLAQLAPDMGFRTILEIDGIDFKNILYNPQTTNIAKRMAYGWVVISNPFNFVSTENIYTIVSEMVNYRLQGTNNTVNANEVYRLTEMMKESYTDSEFLSLIWDKLLITNNPDTPKDKLLPATGYISQLIELFTILKTTSQSQNYALEKFDNDEDARDKAILNDVLLFNTTWNFALEDSSLFENDINSQNNKEQNEAIDKILEETFSQLMSNEIIVQEESSQENGENKENGKNKENTKEETLKFNNLDTVAKKIKKEVLCQDDVVDEIVSSFSLPATGLRDKNRPVRSIIAAGSTGVGKALHKNTPILTPNGYTTVEELNTGDTIFSGEGKPCTITAKYQPKTPDHYILSFSNGDSIISCGDHLWNINNKNGETLTVDTRSLFTSVHEHKKLAYIMTPVLIDDTMGTSEIIDNICSQDDKMSALCESIGFDNAVKVIVHHYCDVLAGENSSSDRDNRALDGSLARSIVSSGKLPSWFYTMPLKARLSAVALIIDLLDNGYAEQSKKSTYIRFEIDSSFYSDLVKLFSTVGCVRYIDKFNSVNTNGEESLNFSISKRVGELSYKLKNSELKKDCYNVSHCVEIVDVEHVDETLVGIDDFYCFTVDSPNALFLCGESNIPTHNTKLAYSLAKNLYKKPIELLRIDMSEYHDKHEAAKLIGAPPGYQGFKEGGVLTRIAKKNPNAIILIDELEKAHPDIMNLFLQLLDAGRLTDGTGETVDFSNNIIIFTTNLGVEERKQNSLGFSGQENAKASKEASTKQALKKFLKPELINRIDEIVVFNDIENGANLIVRQEISLLRDKMKEQGFTIRRIPDNIVQHILAKSDFKTYGARDIQRIVRKEVSEKIAKEILKETKQQRNKKATKEKTELTNIALSIKNGMVIAKTQEPKITT